jgi:hypothetical protein
MIDIVINKLINKLISTARQPPLSPLSLARKFQKLLYFLKISCASYLNPWGVQESHGEPLTFANG